MGRRKGASKKEKRGGLDFLCHHFTLWYCTSTVSLVQYYCSTSTSTVSVFCLAQFDYMEWNKKPIYMCIYIYIYIYIISNNSSSNSSSSRNKQSYRYMYVYVNPALLLARQVTSPALPCPTVFFLLCVKINFSIKKTK
jgi:hypothetical protein